MKGIENKIWSHISIEDQFFGGKKRIDFFEGYTSVSKVRSSNGININSFKALIHEVAKISLNNSLYDTYYRGQVNDYRDKNNRTTIYPKICRPEIKMKKVYTKTIENRYKTLNDFVNYIKTSPYNKSNFSEYYFSLIQHYEILPTPFIDITHSILTAATFALSNSKTGYFYIFGLPYNQGSISHFIDSNIVLIKLRNICPANSKRPHYQEGFLAGRLPFLPKKESGDNIAKRLIGKFFLDNSNNNFWDDDFKPLPNSVLFPNDDDFKNEMEILFKEFKQSV